VVERLRLSAIVVAAGSSTRAGCDKLFAQIGGRPVIQYALDAFEQTPCVDEMIVVCRADMTDAIQSLFTNGTKLRAIISGGERRQDSVAAGLDAVSPSAEFVAVHDGARPLITPGEIERVFSAAQKHGAAALAAPVTDTLKIVDTEQFVGGSVERGQIFAMQTPQIFRRKLLIDAFDRVASKSLDVTDEVSAVQLLGAKVAIMPARDHNMKITFASDLALAEFVLRHRSSS
jgi:2-C-methyl-D-erythritol 4-phosphate cytidylyltransferase